MLPSKRSSGTSGSKKKRVRTGPPKPPNFADIVVVKGEFKHNKGLLFDNIDMSPYVAFEYNQQHYATTFKEKAGLYATWDQRFRMKPIAQPNTIYFQVFSKSALTD